MRSRAIVGVMSPHAADFFQDTGPGVLIPSGAMNRTPSITRREFIVATGALAGGMALALAQRPANGAAAPADSELTPWLVIGADDSVIVRVTAPEAGTGITTQAAMYVAEELQCAWESLRVE